MSQEIYLECISSLHNKFWFARLEETDQDIVLIRRWGRIGDSGSGLEERYKDRTSALRTFHALVSSKIKKGYVLSKAPYYFYYLRHE